MQVYLHSFSFPGRVAPAAAHAERLGFDGFLLADSQNLNADIWVELALAGAATDRLVVGPGVTNPVSRHPAVTASAAMTLHAETGGRAVLGVGRGDTALARIGRPPVALADFERAIVALQHYLGGRPVDYDGATDPIAWSPGPDLGKVELSVAATGPKVIALAARHAEQVDFTVGAEHARLRWAARTATATSDDVSLGAYVNVAVHPDRTVARDLVRGSAAIFARFATHGAPLDGLSEATRDGIARLGARYDEARHGQAAAPQAQQLDDDFIDRFAVVGSSQEVIDRLAQIGELGIERVIVVAGSLDADPALVEESNERFAAEVLPALR